MSLFRRIGCSLTKAEVQLIMALHAELHRHLGGAVVPRVFWRYLVRHDHPLAKQYPDYEAFETFFTAPRSSLSEYLELHSIVESVQTMETIPYFVSKLVRGAYVFEGICYLELRYTPYYRTDPTKPEEWRIGQMRDIVKLVAESSSDARYPLLMRQIVCMHSLLPYTVNRAMIELAASEPNLICGIDLAGPDTHYSGRMDEWIDNFKYARMLGLKTTAHLFETANGCDPRLLPFLDRIGHGIQIPLRYPKLLSMLSNQGQCLEICPTTYLKTGTLSDLSALREVFVRCKEAGVDITINTDNAGLHNVRLPWEYENLLTQDIIDFDTLNDCQDAAFRHAFAWPNSQRTPKSMLNELIGAT
jgi:adenosine deaminase